MTTHYIGLIHKEPQSDFGVSFPDFPGCVTAGRTLDEARNMAEEALLLHAEGLAQDGHGLPTPSSLDEIMVNAANRDAVAILVGLESSAPSVQINITVPETDLRAIDSYARAHGITRSGLMVKAARDVIGQKSG